jgi:NitT/TauT family transport system substrate-binding protein
MAAERFLTCGHRKDETLNTSRGKSLAGLSRRSLLGGAAAALASWRPGAGMAEPAQGLEILAAPTGASITLARAFDSGALAGAAPGASLRM